MPIAILPRRRSQQFVIGLRTARPNKSMKGSAVIEKRFLAFWEKLPRACRESGLNQRQLPFLDYRMLVAGWIETNPTSRG